MVPGQVQRGQHGQQYGGLQLDPARPYGDRGGGVRGLPGQRAGVCAQPSRACLYLHDGGDGDIDGCNGAGWQHLLLRAAQVRRPAGGHHGILGQHWNVLARDGAELLDGPRDDRKLCGYGREA